MSLAALGTGPARSRPLTARPISRHQQEQRWEGGCATAVPGFAAIQETFTSYDESSMHFAYQATEGRPWFLKRAENHWIVRALGPETCEVETRAEIDLPLFPGLLLAPLLKLQMGRVGVRTLEELKYYLEHDQVHPRKRKVQQQQRQQALARS